MHRPGGTTRVSDEFFSHTATTIASPKAEQQLPTFNPDSVAGKREKSRFRSAETVVHVIPLLLVLCAVTLWFFSSPVEMVKNGGNLQLE